MRTRGADDCERTLGRCGGDCDDIGDEEGEASAKGRGEHLGTERCWRGDFGETLGTNEPRSNNPPVLKASGLRLRGSCVSGSPVSMGQMQQMRGQPTTDCYGFMNMRWSDCRKTCEPRAPGDIDLMVF